MSDDFIIKQETFDGVGLLRGFALTKKTKLYAIEQGWVTE